MFCHEKNRRQRGWVVHQKESDTVCGRTLILQSREEGIEMVLGMSIPILSKTRIQTFEAANGAKGWKEDQTSTLFFGVTTA